MLAAGLGGLIYLFSADMLFQPACFSGEVGRRLSHGIGWVSTPSSRQGLINHDANESLPLAVALLQHTLRCCMFGRGQLPCCLQVLGCLLIAGGVLSVLGSMRKNTNMLTGALATALIGMLLAFSFVAQVRQSCIQPECTASSWRGHPSSTFVR